MKILNKKKLLTYTLLLSFLLTIFTNICYFTACAEESTEEEKVYANKIVVVVKDEDGNALSDVSVTAGKGHTTTTNADGKAVFKKLNVGKYYKFSASIEGYTIEPLTVNAVDDLRFKMVAKKNVEPTPEPVPLSTVIDKNGNAANTVLRIATGYELADGSIDVWMTGTAVYIGNGMVITSAENVGFTGPDDGRYQQIISSKVNVYNEQLNINLYEYDSVVPLLSTYLCLPDGTYEKATVSSSENGITVISYPNHDEHIETAVFSEQDADGDVIAIGYSAGDLEITADSLSLGTPVISEAYPVMYELTASSQDNVFTLSGDVNRGFKGGIITNNAGKIVGIITSCDGSQGTGIKSGSVITYVNSLGNSVDTESETLINTEEVKENISSGTDSTEPESEESEDTSTVKTDLFSKIEYVKTLNSENYTSESWQALMSSVTYAAKLIELDNISEEDLSAALTDINNSISLLEIHEEDSSFFSNIDSLLIPITVGVILFVVVVIVIVYIVVLKPFDKKKKTNNKVEVKTSLPAVPKDVVRVSATDATTILTEGMTPSNDGLSGKWAKLVRKSDGKEIEINSVPFTIGRAEGNSYQVTDVNLVGRKHCKIDFKEGLFYIEDLSSHNGTKVGKNSLKPNSPQRLYSESTIILATVDEYTFYCGNK